MKIELKILKHGKDIYTKHSLPEYATCGSAAMDLRCAEDVTIYPGETITIKTGLALWIGSTEEIPILPTKRPMKTPTWEPMGVGGLIIPRSSVGTRGLVLANTVGLIDSDYQGELLIKAWNRKPPMVTADQQMNFHYLNNNCVELTAGDRIAQLMFVPVIKAEWNVVEEFSNLTERGEGSFGSTGNG